MNILIKVLTLIGLASWVLTACVPPGSQHQQPQPANQVKLPETKEELLNIVSESATEFRELSKPSRLKAWVDKLMVKAQPGKEFRHIALLKEGEVVKYLYQRTLRKERHQLRGQDYNEPWLLIQTKDSIVGWVHGGGVIFVQPDLNDLFAIKKPSDKQPSAETPAAHQRTRSPQSPPPPSQELSEEQIREKERLDFLIVPGKRVGPLHLKTSEDDLIRMYGPAVSRGEVIKTPSVKEPCTVLMGGTYDEMRITWKDEKRSQVKAVYIERANGRWHTAEGLRVGMSLLDLTKINRSPVSFYGFDWEYSGTIESYRKGRLAPYQKLFYLVLAPESPKTPLQGFTGNKIFTSQTDGVEELTLAVSRIVVYLD